MPKTKLTKAKAQLEQNCERVNRAGDVVRTYLGKTCDTTQSAVTDALADLMHFCEWQKLDFEELLLWARHHYECESKGID